MLEALLARMERSALETLLVTVQNKVPTLRAQLLETLLPRQARSCLRPNCLASTDTQCSDTAVERIHASRFGFPS